MLVRVYKRVVFSQRRIIYLRIRGKKKYPHGDVRDGNTSHVYTRKLVFQYNIIYHVIRCTRDENMNKRPERTLLSSFFFFYIIGSRKTLTES